MAEEKRTDVLADVRIAVTRSAGGDRAVVVFIDTTFEPDGSGTVPGLRVLVNDGDAFVGVPYENGNHQEAETQHFQVRLDEIPYIDKER